MMWRYTAPDGTTCRIEIPPLPGENYEAWLTRTMPLIRDAMGITPVETSALEWQHTKARARARLHPPTRA